MAYPKVICFLSKGGNIMVNLKVKKAKANIYCTNCESLIKAKDFYVETKINKVTLSMHCKKCDKLKLIK